MSPGPSPLTCRFTRRTPPEPLNYAERRHVGEHRLVPVPVTGVPAVPARRVMLRIPQVSIQLAFQGALEHDLGQPAQQAARPGQRQALGLRPLRQLPGELQLGRLPAGCLAIGGRPGRLLRCCHGVPSSDGTSVRLVPGVTPLKLRAIHIGAVFTTSRPRQASAALHLEGVTSPMGATCTHMETPFEITVPSALSAADE